MTAFSPLSNRFTYTELNSGETIPTRHAEHIDRARTRSMSSAMSAFEPSSDGSRYQRRLSVGNAASAPPVAQMDEEVGVGKC